MSPFAAPARPRGAPLAGRVLAGVLASLGSGTVAAAIGLARLVSTWMGARHGGPTADSWVYRPAWTMVEMGFALVAAVAALVVVTIPAGRRAVPVGTAVVAAAVLGWALNDGAYQVIASLYYLGG